MLVAGAANVRKRSKISCRDTSIQGNPRAGRGTRKDSARDATWRDGRYGRSSLRVVLRQRRLHAFVRDASGSIFSAHGKLTAGPGVVAQLETRAGVDRYLW